MYRVIPPLPQYGFMAWYSVEVQGQLYLYLLTFNFYRSLKGRYKHLLRSFKFKMKNGNMATARIRYFSDFMTSK
jgi:hypothetical protein